MFVIISEIHTGFRMKILRFYLHPQVLTSASLNKFSTTIYCFQILYIDYENILLIEFKRYYNYTKIYDCISKQDNTYTIRQVDRIQQNTIRRRYDTYINLYDRRSSCLNYSPSLYTTLSLSQRCQPGRAECGPGRARADFLNCGPALTWARRAGPNDFIICQESGPGFFSHLLVQIF